MNIGIFTECYKPTINGVVMSIESFREELEKKGHNVYIFAPRYHKNIALEENIFRIPSISLLSPKDYPIALPFFQSSFINTVANALKLDIIHTQHIFLMGGLGQKIAKQLNIPTVHTYHTMMTEYTHYVPLKILQKSLRRLIIWRSRQFCNHTNIVIVPSSPIQEVLQQYGVKTKIEILPTGIKLKNFRKLTLKERRTIFHKYHIPFEKQILLFVGRLAQEKNLDFLIEAFSEILKKNSKVFLVLVGSGPYEKILKSKIKNLRLQNNVALTGFLAKEEANKFFGAADLFVFPSTTETQGIVLAESLASSTPVVAINQFGPKDIVKNGKDGFLVPLQKEAFIEKILYLLNNHQVRQKFAHCARESAKQFDIKLCAEKLIKIYNKVINDYHQTIK